MEARFFNEWVEKLRGCSDSRERRVILQHMEPLLEGWAQIEREVLFPILQRFLCFSEWMQEARARERSLRELIRNAHSTQDHEHILDITDELGNQLLEYMAGVRNVLLPRLTQTLKRPELEELRFRMGRYWLLIDTVPGQEAA